MIRQVRLKEKYQDATGVLTARGNPVFAFGTHPQITGPDDAHPVTSATAVGNKLRIIMDELLVGNNLQQIECRQPVNTDGAFDSVPIGATPDDVARCSVASDVLPKSCPASNPHSMCICQIATGCGVTGEIKMNMPVGVKDVNQDGAADGMRMMPNSVGLKCGSIDVPIDLNNSYWNPSGDQNVPAMGGFDALGPAIVLQPDHPLGMASIPQFLPTNTTCSLVFDPAVVDKSGIKVCAPPDGDITKNCTPGNVDAFTFRVEPLAIDNALSNVHDGDTGVSRTDGVQLYMTAPVSAASISAITVTEGSTSFTAFTATQSAPDQIKLTWTGATGLAANTMYTITVGTGLTDVYNQAAPMPSTISFMTGS
ncbi:MAG TPA: Ig-like domain-containing protein [Kofleriaceae bacterium]|nr:Ig-like domain-containing protein [Kofleriaceae bacterium]